MSLSMKLVKRSIAIFMSKILKRLLGAAFLRTPPCFSWHKPLLWPLTWLSWWNENESSEFLCFIRDLDSVVSSQLCWLVFCRWTTSSVGEVIKSGRGHYGRSCVSGERCVWGRSALRSYVSSDRLKAARRWRRANIADLNQCFSVFGVVV